jgi:hypothetical protein
MRFTMGGREFDLTVAAHRNSRFSLTDIRVESVLRLRG